MYLPSNTPLLTDQRAAAARKGAESDARVQAMRRTSACGRARLFNTLINPHSLSEALGTGVGLDAAKLQQQTQTSRASGILSTGESYSAAGANDGTQAGPSVAEIIRNAPEVVSLNRGGGCQTQNVYKPVPLPQNLQPGMPQRAPAIVQTPNGPLSFHGAPSTIPGDYPPYGISGRATSQPSALPVTGYFSILHQGLTGYAPPWSDAGVLSNDGVQDGSGVGVGGWIMDHPWLALLLAGGGVYALSRRKHR